MIIDFSIFIVLQAFFINGIKYCFEKGSIFYKVAPRFFESTKGKIWTMNLWGCVRCMSSVWGALTFWTGVLMVYGWDWKEIPLFFFDIGILIPLNWVIYKKM